MGHKGDLASRIYDIFMIVVILLSIVPLMFMKVYPAFRVIEKVTVIIFIIDLLSILPGLNLLGNGFKIFRVTRLMRILRLLKLFRYSDSIQLLGKVLRKERKVLMAVLCITEIGRFVGMLSSLVGVGIIALPSGVMTASYLDEIRSLKRRKKKELDKDEEEQEDDSQEDIYSVLDET